jgi:hypothetical protein
MNGTDSLRKAWLLTFSSLAVVASASAAVSERPSEAIAKRNVFRLVAPQPEKKTVDAAPLPKIILTGFTTFFSRRVIFRVQWPAQAGAPAHEESFMLSEGERAGSIEVLQMDAAAGSARFRVNGTVLQLSLDKDGPKPANSPPVPPVRL